MLNCNFMCHQCCRFEDCPNLPYLTDALVNAVEDSTTDYFPFVEDVFSPARRIDGEK